MAFPGYESYGAPDLYAGYGAYAAVPYGAAAPPVVAGYGSEDLRTVFITGFPNDVKERELNNLLRFIPGYEASQMNWKNGQAQGFALFMNGGAARAACDQIGGLCFDDGVHLRAEMAHKNMYIKDAPEAGAKRPRTTGAFSGPMPGAFPPANRTPTGVYAPVSNTKDNPPCNTLFVGNLSDTVDEEELQGLFSPQPGFMQLKMVRSSRNISCFVEFDTVANAIQCHTTQQGAVLRSSDRGPIRIQYSKNPLGKKRDASGQMIDTTQRGAPVPADEAAALTTAYGAAGGAGVQYNAGAQGL